MMYHSLSADYTTIGEQKEQEAIGTVRKRNPVYIKLAGYIWGYIKTEEVTAEDLAEAAGIAMSTFYKRLSNPEEFRYSELVGIAERMGVTVGELIGG